MPASSPLVARPGSLPTTSADDILAGDVGVLVDARAGERYRGEVEPIDPVAGHIPGAVNVPTAGNLAPDGTFLDSSALRERFTAAGVVAGRAGGRLLRQRRSRPPTSCWPWRSPASARTTSLYAPSWSGWIVRPDPPDRALTRPRGHDQLWCPADAAHLGGTRGGEEALEVGGAGAVDGFGPRAPANWAASRPKPHSGRRSGRIWPDLRPDRGGVVCVTRRRAVGPGIGDTRSDAPPLQELFRPLGRAEVRGISRTPMRP